LGDSAGQHPADGPRRSRRPHPVRTGPTHTGRGTDRPRTRELRFNIRLLAQRLTGAVDWLAGAGTVVAGAARGDPSLPRLPIGVFGASTGAAAALIAAADRPDQVYAVVSRGGRPDLAADALPRVQVPVLLVVGGADRVVIGLNEQATARLARPELTLVPGATHLFEEPGALEQVTELAADWFDRWLPVERAR
jgi:putative phosphoribosyl transferase